MQLTQLISSDCLLSKDSCAYGCQAPEIEICVATLVTPSVLVPNEHYWLKSKQPWLELGDSLPKYLKNDRQDIAAGWQHTG